MHIDHDDDVFLGAEAMVVFPVEQGPGDPDWEADDPAEEELTLHETIRTLLQLRGD